MIKNKLARLVDDALRRAIESGRLHISHSPVVEIERPREKAHGDWAANIALTLAKEAGVAPRAVADIILDEIDRPAYIADMTIAGPGFINFRLSNTWLYEALAAVRTQGDRYGWSELPAGENIQIEFVSANPVGPMHVGHGRWAAVGDSLARLLLAAGCEVHREFYINDWGNQMVNFGVSVAARYREILGQPLSLPEDGYRGHYVIDIAQEIVGKDGGKYLDLDPEQQGKLFADRAYKQVLEHIRKTLEEMDVIFDCWFSERALHDSGELDETLALLEKGGHSYRADGALWLRTTDFGDDKDRVMVRENGEPTYFAADIAYHRDKLSRGYTKLINIWGADHHGYVGRMQAAMTALGAEPGTLEIIIGQLVSLYSGGRPIKMSKRTGEMVTLEELLTEVGRDAVRYFFLMRGTDTALDFDIELAKSETAENPVYYVQYAHARICSILRHATEQSLVPAGTDADLAVLDHQAEVALLRELAEAPSVIMRAAANRTPYRLTKYLEEVAALFHQFYHQCRVVSDDKGLSEARLALCDGTRQVIKNVLWLVGVSAPEKM